MPKRAAPPLNGVPLEVALAPAPAPDPLEVGPAVPAVVGRVPLDAPPVGLLKEPVEKPLGEPMPVTRGAVAEAEPVP